MNHSYDVIIVGGSYAGLSAAMALGRSTRNVLIIDSGLPCNRQTPHSHNFLTQDGVAPHEIAGIARKQVEKYETVHIVNALATHAERLENVFQVTTDDGEIFRGEKLVLATGVRDLMPVIDGFSACWGTSVIHCPYCHGYEFRGQKTGIFANGERAYHLASLVKNLTEDVTIFTSGAADFSIEQKEKLRAHQIPVIETPVAAIEHENGWIRNLHLDNNTKIALDALYAAIPFEQHSAIPYTLGCEITPSGHIKTDLFQKTTVPGVFACGDNCSPMRSVANAVYTGNFVGAMVNKEITDSRF